MPKRRQPGRPTRIGRRRRDRQPNVPQITQAESSIEQPEEGLAEASVPSGGRRLRPTLRAQTPATSRFVRIPAPQLDLSAEYEYVVRDLRQIGLLAVLAFLVLGGLALVIR